MIFTRQLNQLCQKFEAIYTTCKFSRLKISPTARFCFIKFIMFSLWFSRYLFTAFGLDIVANCCSFSFTFACNGETVDYSFCHAHIQKHTHKLNRCLIYRYSVIRNRYCLPESLEVWLHKAAYLVPQTRIGEYRLPPSD